MMISPYPAKMEAFYVAREMTETRRPETFVVSTFEGEPERATTRTKDMLPIRVQHLVLGACLTLIPSC